MRRIIDFLIVAADLQWRAYRRQLTFKESCLTLYIAWVLIATNKGLNDKEVEE